MASLKTETIQLGTRRTEKKSTCISFARVFAENYPPGSERKQVFAEMIGTYLLVCVSSGTAALNAIDESKITKLGASLAGGFIVTVMIYSIGHISGAHMNPAASLAFATFKHFPWKQVPFYAATQVAGAISASFTLKAALDPARQLGPTSPSGTNTQARIMEILATFIVMFISSVVATDSKATSELAGVAVGSSLSIAFSLGKSMNPTRSLGPAFASSSCKGLWVYLVGPLTGALPGAMLYTVIQETNKTASAISASSLPLILQFMNSIDKNEQATNKDPFSFL